MRSLPVLRLIVACALAMAGSFATATENRLSSLTESYLIKNLEQGEDWETEVHDTYIKYVCLSCGGRVEAILEVTPLRAVQSRSALRQSYLAERKLKCARLAINSVGRCTGTAETKMRGSALWGFRSDLEFTNTREVEVVFYYNDQYWGPEVIKTTISIESGATALDGTVEMFRTHMAKLTLFW